MKPNIFTITVFILISSFIVPFQRFAIKPDTGNFDYSFAAVNSDGTPDINLDKSSAIYQVSKGKTVTAVLNIDGAKSAVRLKNGVSEFLAHHPDNGDEILPQGIGLYKLNADKKNRSLSLDATGVISATRVIIFSTKIDNQTFRIAIKGGISTPGEYAFVEKNMTAANSILTAWCFGID